MSELIITYSFELDYVFTKSIIDPSSIDMAWILANGFWNDDGIWVDSDVWID